MAANPTLKFNPSANKLQHTGGAAPRYHPLFASPEADTILRSTDGKLYRIPSYTLRTTSGLFQTMFSLPQPQIESRMQTHIPAFEPSNLLDKFLCMLSGLSIPPWESFDDVESILTVAEKWDTPGPIETIRSSLTSPMFLSDPLRLYTIATHFGWDAEAKLASKHSLTLCLSSAIHQATLQSLSTKHLLPLLELHRRRRDQFKVLIDSPERFTAGNSVDPPMHCARCGEVPLENHTWRELKGVMFLEMDRRPLGDTVLSKLDLCEWPEAEACWEARCSKEGCGSLNYDKVATLRQIRNCLDLLPTTI